MTRMYWVGQKVHRVFLYHLMEKPKQAFWPTQQLEGEMKRDLGEVKETGVFFDLQTLLWHKVATSANADFSVISRKVESKTKTKTILFPLLLATFSINLQEQIFLPEMRALSILCFVYCCEKIMRSHVILYHLLFSCSVMSDSATPWTTAHQASLSFTISWSLLRRMSTESVVPFNHLILCHPILLLPSIFPSIRVFSNELALCIQWPEYWSFRISPSNEYSGLISFRIDWFDLLAVQGSLKSLLQHHNLKVINSLALRLLYVLL